MINRPAPTISCTQNAADDLFVSLGLRYKTEIGIES